MVAMELGGAFRTQPRKCDQSRSSPTSLRTAPNTRTDAKKEKKQKKCTQEGSNQGNEENMQHQNQKPIRRKTSKQPFYNPTSIIHTTVCQPSNNAPQTLPYIQCIHYPSSSSPRSNPSHKSTSILQTSLTEIAKGKYTDRDQTQKL